MTERAYTIQEIDQLRRISENKFLWGRYGGPKGNANSRSYRCEELTNYVEQTVRTHMMAGLTAKDILVQEK